ncbi:bifunctional riboflavin kinase/FAD synthetase [Sodalis sp. CWE]|uniref:bifunctional riboflavin kinase/FAD synthetase n=1 Tax=Sodalis sp. CWE TaxID=2803816 RepID=UPI001C7E1AF8|nr:bifunctional riboflavin kinase/FAD synthetase [Sodalis sp. CWE]MBX4180721.1 bifunctional riboflavin kinase/FAD synthetase [Sodalis sp. CWE]
MKLIRNVHNLQKYPYECVLTIGNFDGFHRGHQLIISNLKHEGRRLGLPVTVMLFEPQPQEYFSGKENAPVRLSCFREKVKYLTASGVDSIICINFNEQFAMLDAQKFITDLLIKKLGVRFISIGDDFRFGAKRQGDYILLKAMGKRAGFRVTNVATCTTKNGERISSTAIRKALVKDQLEKAENLLGHPYRLSGRVIYGDMIGKNIGFPTANISLKGRRMPIHGVYAVKVHTFTSAPLLGVANIGVRPTVSSNKNQKLEVHLLDIDKNLYGQYLEVLIHAKLRNEKKFSSLEDLKNQIVLDIRNTRNFFKLNHF